MKKLWELDKWRVSWMQTRNQTPLSQWCILAYRIAKICRFSWKLSIEILYFSTYTRWLLLSGQREVPVVESAEADVGNPGGKVKGRDLWPQHLPDACQGPVGGDPKTGQGLPVAALQGGLPCECLPFTLSSRLCIYERARERRGGGGGGERGRRQ